MILVTGAAGKTGQAVVRALAGGQEPVRAWVRRPEQQEALLALGASEAVSGDMLDPQAARAAFTGARAVYHICPNMSQDELAIAELVFNTAKAAGLEHFVYHSVLHPQVEAMPHHWLKMRAEELLFTTGLPFTVLQPGPYMQNVLAYWDAVTRWGIYSVPYAVEARLSVIDLDDVAQTAAKVLSQPGHAGAIYELAGPQALSQAETAAILAQKLGRPVQAVAADRQEWQQRVQAAGMPDYSIQTLLKMFIYYENYGLVGSPRVLEWLLGRPPCSFDDFVQRTLQGA